MCEPGHVAGCFTPFLGAMISASRPGRVTPGATRGGSNVWSMMSADEEAGYVYLPTGTPASDYFGGHRLGDNLFAESLVCVDVETGEHVWHFPVCAPWSVGLRYGFRTELSGFDRRRTAGEGGGAGDKARRSAGAGGRRWRAIISRPAWRTRSSGTSRSSVIACALGRQPGKSLNRCLRATCSIG